MKLTRDRDPARGVLRIVSAAWLTVVACTPTGSTDKAPTHASPYELGVMLHRVMPGESLSAIAERYAVRGGWQALATLNDIPNPDDLRAGVGLRVPFNITSIGLPGFRRSVLPPLDRSLCDTRIASSPVAVEQVGCVQASCSDLGATRACVCFDGDHWRGSITGTHAWTWTLPPVRADMDRFMLQSIDLDSNGVDEWVFAMHVNTSNGVGIPTTAVAVFDENHATPLQFLTHTMPQSLAFPDVSGECLVRTDEVGGAVGQRGGSGVYRTSQDYHYRDGTLRPVWTPVVVGTQIGTGETEPVERWPDYATSEDELRQHGLVVRVARPSKGEGGVELTVDHGEGESVFQVQTLRLYEHALPIAYSPTNLGALVGLQATVAKRSEWDTEYVVDLELADSESAFPTARWRILGVVPSEVPL
ncbi:MAG: LysM peptidoglycan-binding domain-containing protein [Nannocystales bacterium]